MTAETVGGLTLRRKLKGLGITHKLYSTLVSGPADSQTMLKYLKAMRSVDNRILINMDETHNGGPIKAM